MSPTKATCDPGQRLQGLQANLDAEQGFQDAISSLEVSGRATFDGVWGSAYALLAAALAERAPRHLVVLCESDEQSDSVLSDLALFSSRLLTRFPAWEVDPAERVVADDAFGDRLRILKELGAEPAEQGRIITASVQSVLQPVSALEQIQDCTRRLEVGQELDLDSFVSWLVNHRFHHTSAVELPGEFSSHGGILDIFAPDWDQPVRIELFGDEVESIRYFEVETQRSSRTTQSIQITVLDPAQPSEAHFFEYLPEDTWFLLVDSDEIQNQGNHYLRLSEQPERLHSVNDTWGRLKPFSVAFGSALAERQKGAVCHLQTESVERFSGKMGEVGNELESISDGQEVFVVVPTDAEVQRLKELFSDTQLERKHALHYVVGRLNQGVRLIAQSVILLSAGELFRRTDLRRGSRRRLGKALDSFVDLRAGDLVVHLAHGIGRYRGTALLDKSGRVEEHLEIEFAEGAKVYVPAVRIDLVQKYVGGTKTRPRLAKLGGTMWQKQKKAAESAVQDIASEMLELQAERLSRSGIPFAPDGEWQREFDASFPYTETDDQMAAIQDIKVDMESSRPMDRLLCGDVGFGKTEVAMRAAFKAVDNGYQVAVLVPTTVLAEQHYHSFMERMAEFPFDIARLSRFCSSAEQREAVEGLAAGRIDIVIGTHRLASRDVHFHNLGLLIIDEEQRFGVEVKERLKQLRSTVDILTMSATPIPRTLHMSLVGVRDISNLETAPQERISVETKLSRFDEKLIRHAIMRELNRGGQIYFVHNRVNDINVLAEKLQRIVPEATYGIGHGQMPEDQLEQVMVDFVAHRFDVLLATTIVESGLDIPNANTIFIDEADRYGLADLHQLRGRVGRYKHRAFCYLLIDPFKHVSPTAAKRLRAIEEYSEMGAGFAISMRDLEIRGAGNLLGVQQSGHIATVGYEFYCQLLETAVRTLQQLPKQLSVDVDIDLPGTAFFPDDFVPDIRLKIDLYRRLRRVSTFDELQAFREEVEDRFGTLPPPVVRLMELAELRLEAAIWQINSVSVEDEYLVLAYDSGQRMEQLARQLGRQLRVVDERKAYWKVSAGPHDPSAFFEAAKLVLRPA